MFPCENMINTQRGIERDPGGESDRKQPHKGKSSKSTYLNTCNSIQREGKRRRVIRGRTRKIIKRPN
jgi:hypothetical protein